jgi:uncharacterized protein YjbI with pentapeptide repeats
MWQLWKSRPSLLKAYDKGKREFSDLDASRRDYRGAHFDKAKFTKVDFTEANFLKAKFSGCEFKDCVFIGADLSQATIERSDLTGCRFAQTKLNGAVVFKSRFDLSFMGMVDFSDARLGDVSFNSAKLMKCNFTNAPIAMCHFEGSLEAPRKFILANRADIPGGDKMPDSDLARAGINRFDNATLNRTIEMHAERASNIGQWAGSGTRQSDGVALYASLDSLRDFFMLTGMPEHAVTGLLRQFQLAPGSTGIFISYSSRDLELAEKLYSWLTRRGFNVWFAPRNMEGGATIRSQLMSIINEVEAVLAILSVDAVNSDWVRTEVVASIRQESQRKKPMLFPVRLAPYEAMREWRFVDEGEDFGPAIRERYIPDLSGWRDDLSFDAAMSEFVKSLSRTNLDDPQKDRERREADVRDRLSQISTGGWCRIEKVGEAEDDLVQVCRLCGERDTIMRGLSVTRKCPRCGLEENPGRAGPWFAIDSLEQSGQRDGGQVRVRCTRQGHVLTYDYASGPPFYCPSCAMLHDLGSLEKDQTQALEACEKARGPEHPSTLSHVSVLAEIMCAKGDLDRAQSLHDRARDVRTRVLGGEHPDTLASAHHAAVTLAQRSDGIAAREELYRVLEIQKRVLGEEHVATLRTMGDLAALEFACRNAYEARELANTAIGAYDKTLGLKHPDALQVMLLFGKIQAILGYAKSGTDHLRHVLENYTEQLGLDHPHTLTAQQELALALWGHGHDEAARDLAEQRLATLTRLYGPNHPDSERALAELEQIKRIMVDPSRQASVRARRAEEAEVGQKGSV